MIEMINLLTRTSTIRFVLVIGMLTLTAAFILGLFFYPYPSENKELINMALVGILNWTSMIVTTYYNKPTPNVETPYDRPRDVAEVEIGIKPTIRTVQQNEGLRRPTQGK